MSDANRVNLAYVAESTYGEVPSGPPTLVNLNVRAVPFSKQVTYVDDTTLRSDRQISYSVLTDATGGGSVPCSFQYGAYDDFLKAALQSSAWTSVVTSTVTCSLAAADNSLNRASGDFTAISGLAANKWIRISGFTTNGTIIYAKIVSIVALKIVLSGITVVNESATSVEIEQGAEITNGTTQPSFAFEKHLQDLTTTFERALGQVVDTMSIDTQVGSILGITLGFLGKPATVHSATFGSGSNTAASTNPVMNAVTNVDAVLESGAEFSIRGMTINTTNNLRERKEVGTLGAVSIGAGTFGATGNITVYSSDGASTIYAKFLNDTTTNLAVRFIDNSGNAYVFEWPNVKYTAGTRDATGINTDVEIPLEFRATLDPTELITMRIQRWAA